VKPYGADLVDDAFSVSLVCSVLIFGIVLAERISVRQIVNGDRQEHVEKDV